MALTLSTQTDLYRFFAIAFNAAPGVTYMNQLYAASESGMSVKQIVNAFTTKTEFTSTYPAFLTNAQFASSLIDNVVGASADAAAKTAAKAQVEAALTAGLSRGDVVYNIFNNLASLTGDATWGGTATLLNNKVAYAKYYTEVMLGGGEATPSLAALKAVVANVTAASSAAAADIAAVLNPAPAPVNQTFTLTTGVNEFTGGAGADTFNASTADSLTVFDKLDGGAGVDTLSANFTGAALPASITVSNIEKFNVVTTGAGFTADTTTGFSGLTDLSVSSSTAGSLALTAAATTNIVGSQAAAGTNAQTVNGGKDVSLSVSGATTGTISVGATTAAKGAVTVSETVTIAPAAAAGAITVNGGTTVSVAQTATATNAIAGTTATQSAVTVTGTADTTSVAVAQSAATAAVAEVFTATFGGASTNGQTITFDGRTFTSAGGYASATLEAAAFITAYNHATANWTAAAGTTAGTVVFTKKVAGSAVDTVLADFTGTGNAQVTAVSTGTQGKAALVNGAVTITDVNSASTTAAGKITTVDLNGFGAATANSNAINTVNLAGTGTSYTQTKGALTTAISTTDALNLKGVTTTGTVDLGAVTKTINLSSTTAANTLNALSANTATALNISGDKALTLTGTTLAAAAVITNTATGAVTITGALGTGQKYVGSAGVDTIAVGASTVASDLGDGNDVLVISNGTTAMGTGGSVAGGAGTDTIKFATYADAVTASAGTTFKAGVTGFEAVDLNGANGAAAAAVNLANLGAGINSVTFSATNTETTTISNLAANGTVKFTINQTNGKAATVNLVDTTGSADVLNVVLSKATALANVELTASGIETVNVTSTETATTLVGNVSHAATLSIVDAKALNISGNAGVTLGTLTGATALTSIDASGVTAGLVSFTTAALANAATIKGGQDANTIVASAATKAVTYTGSEKVDNITISNALNNVVSTAGGNDVITTGSGADTINAGAGDDSITSGSGLDLIDVGTGTDTYVVTANANGNVYATITGMTKGDKIDFIDTQATFTTAKISLAGTAAFADYLSAAAAGAANRVVWFQYGGDTYLVQDRDGGAAFLNGTDQVVKLVGAVDLSTATIDGAATNVLTLG